MNNFKALYDNHRKLLGHHKNSSPNMCTLAHKFIVDLSKSGSNIYTQKERERLRTILRYWISYVNRNCVKQIDYPVDIMDYSGPHVRQWKSLVILGLIIVHVFMIGLVLLMALNTCGLL